MGRVYPVAVERSEADAAAITALSEEYDRLVSETDSAEALPPEVDARLEDIDKALQALGPDFDYPVEVKARAGIMVLLGHDGLARFERGLVRPEDVVSNRAFDPEAPDIEGEDDGTGTGGDAGREGRREETEPDEGPGLSDRLLIDLTAHKTMGLRDAVQADAAAALATVVHALALQVFYPGYGMWTPLQLRLTVNGLDRLAPGVEDGPAGRRVRDRCEAWGARLPEREDALWEVLAPMRRADLLDLMACCVGVGLYAVRDPHDRRPGALALAERLATEVGLDMAGTWERHRRQLFQSGRQGAGAGRCDRGHQCRGSRSDRRVQEGRHGRGGGTSGRGQGLASRRPAHRTCGVGGGRGSSACRWRGGGDGRRRLSLSSRSRGQPRPHKPRRAPFGGRAAFYWSLASGATNGM